eukprot:TRINITY_DN33035_c0_g1_i1.p1 TRINITY_DN33035_c0_g1~~TRINITY_DN33035_c0_g1_i1.p1  ORF type:complete len:395 (+),score=75.52 TRINITY_DN33035_c0_g1_i1:101-1285(+)
MSFTGVVKSISYENGYGFIESPQVTADYGKDAFFLRNSLGGYYVSKGDSVSFEMSESERGPTATDIQVHTDPPVFLGEIKSFNAGKGWGLIKCEVTEEAYGKDVFLLKSQLVDGYQPDAGDLVRFEVEETPKGPQARGVKNATRKYQSQTPVAGAGATALPAGTPQQLLAQLELIGTALGLQLGSAGAGGGGLPSGGPAYTGVVKSFGQKGWGMIECPGTMAIYGKDMFFLKSSLLMGEGSISVGQQVQFTVGMGDRGTEAKEIRPVGGAPGFGGFPGGYGGYGGHQMPPHMAAAAMLGGAMGMGGSGPYMGVVKSFNDEKGWGFVSCDETMALYGKDMFLHKAELNGYAPSPGQQVQFSVTNGGNGKWHAGDIVFLGGGGGKGGGKRSRGSPY